MICAAANSLWLAGCLGEYRQFRGAIGNVAAEQTAILHRLLAVNTSTEFGRQHGFSTIRTIRDYQARVPLRDYEEFRPWVNRLADGESGVLTREDVRLFEPTSGSSQAAKWIPYTASLQREFQRGIRTWVADLFLHDPKLLLGPAYWSVSPVGTPEQRTNAGIPIGFADDSAYVGGWQQRLVNTVLAVPASVRRLVDMDRFWHTTLWHLLRRRDLRFISVWNPSFLMILTAKITEFGDALARELPSRRAGELRAALRAGTPGERHLCLWPALRLISCWADANAAPAVQQLTALFPQARLQGKGLLATEGFVSLPWTPAGDAAMLAFRSHFLEFLPVGSTVPQLAHELEPGQQYEVVLTTGGGLYRYRLQDLVEVVGRWRQCPLIRFIGRSGYISDWHGEKLNEAHVGKMLRSVFTAHQIASAFTLLAYDEVEGASGYVLYVETNASNVELERVCAAVETGLHENYHYSYARRLGQLAPLRIARVQNAAATYVSHCVAEGQRAGDIKMLALDRRSGWSARLEAQFLCERRRHLA